MKRHTAVAVLMLTVCSASLLPAAYAETELVGGAADPAKVSEAANLTTEAANDAAKGAAIGDTGTNAHTSSVPSAASSTSSATEAGQVSGLSLDDAIGLAITNSYSLKSALSSYQRSGINLETAADNLDYIPTGTGTGEDGASSRSAWKQYNSSNVNYLMALRNIDTVKDQIAYKTVVAYYGVLSSERALQTTETSLEIARAEEQAALAKASKGKLSGAARDEFVQSRIEAEQSLTQAQDTLKQKRESLLTMLGMGLNETLVLSDTPAYQEPEKLDIETYIQKVISYDPTIWQKERSVELAELNVTYFSFNSSDGEYELVKMSVADANSELTNSKKELGESLRSTYYNQQNLQQQYEQVQGKLTAAHNALTIVNKKWERGLVTQIDVMKAEQSVSNLEVQLQDLLLQMDEVQRVLEAPWID
ncbi:TolC family protein [Paenibacillus massiliensis]|uniref:TolC family protein n=1 Tax=Paenibacillus massiliensis TaxID=225917 RepID=UPI000380C519|nr:TolC family protein [Paenibacillus massiliensis]